MVFCAFAPATECLHLQPACTGWPVINNIAFGASLMARLGVAPLAKGAAIGCGWRLDSGHQRSPEGVTIQLPEQ